MNFVSTSVLHLLHSRQTRDRNYSDNGLQGMIYGRIFFYTNYNDSFNIREYIETTEIVHNSFVNNMTLYFVIFISLSINRII